ncbi:AfsR/SARP family transcriptional regulator [Solihabitans fulvus]|uniref:AfsR/SARP family transcriptional regulator n=1 Tax=Solihabitans fulvus TaxID=1892852 RepID=UPI001CB76426|nr:BTAD domain-containing putative transcriptional regulator [Solihabitans fulvus]
MLGPVRAWRDGVEVGLGSPQQRAILARLLLNHGHAVTLDQLVDAVWGDGPPARAVAALRTYASRMRAALEPDEGPSVLVSAGRTYRLRSLSVDLDEFERRVASAGAARADGRPADARELLVAALALCGGEPLAGVPGPYARGQRDRLAERVLGVLESRLELDLELGRHAEVAAEATALAAEHPLRERLRGVLMLALWRCGRQAEALGVFAETRRVLVEELGIEPGPDLAELHRRVLAADPGLAGATVRPSVPRPAQLPPDIADFTGRAGAVAGLATALTTSVGRAVAVVAVAGIGGVGKTTLALHVAHAVSGHFPDGQLYVDLQGVEAEPAEPGAVLAGFLRALGVAESAVPRGLGERAALFRSVVADRKVLVLLDNAHSVDQVRPLLPGAPGCAVLVTSRTRLSGLPAALVDLAVLEPEEAVELFVGVAGREQVVGERAAVLDVVAACGFLPLAVRVAASRLASRPQWTVACLSRKLADRGHRLRELRTGDLAVSEAFRLSYTRLDAVQARAFRLLALPEETDFSLPVAAAALDLDLCEAEDVLESLVDASLLHTRAPGRYGYHSLLKLYARQQIDRQEGPPIWRQVEAPVDLWSRRGDPLAASGARN